VPPIYCYRVARRITRAVESSCRSTGLRIGQVSPDVVVVVVVVYLFRRVSGSRVHVYRRILSRLTGEKPPSSEEKGFLFPTRLIVTAEK